MSCSRLTPVGAALVALLLVTAGASSQTASRPTGAAAARAALPAPIDRNGVLMLIRTSLIALHQANQTGNYTVLRDLGAPAFQAANTAARLAEIFASQRAESLDLSGVAVLDPQLTVLPEIDRTGMMRMAGFFPSVPLQVNFELVFAPVEGRWRLFGVSVNVGPSAPVAPEPAPAAQRAKPDPATPQAAAKPAAKPAASPPARPVPPAKPVPSQP